MSAAIRKNLLRTLLVMSPFLLAACGDDPNKQPGKGGQGSTFTVLALVLVGGIAARDLSRAKLRQQPTI